MVRRRRGYRLATGYGGAAGGGNVWWRSFKSKAAARRSRHIEFNIIWREQSWIFWIFGSFNFNIKMAGKACRIFGCTWQP